MQQGITCSLLPNLLTIFSMCDYSGAASLLAILVLAIPGPDFTQCIQPTILSLACCLCQCGRGDADGEDDILLCDGLGCGRALHMQCLEVTPLSPPLTSLVETGLRTWLEYCACMRASRC